MTKETYDVSNNPTNSPPKDTSYRSFICALLVFLAICLIILLATINWSGGKNEATKNGGSSAASERKGQKNDETHPAIKKTTTPLPLTRKTQETTTSKKKDESTTLPTIRHEHVTKNTPSEPPNTEAPIIIIIQPLSTKVPSAEPPTTEPSHNTEPSITKSPITKVTEPPIFVEASSILNRDTTTGTENGTATTPVPNTELNVLNGTTASDFNKEDLGTKKPTESPTISTIMQRIPDFRNKSVETTFGESTATSSVIDDVSSNTISPLKSSTENETDLSEHSTSGTIDYHQKEIIADNVTKLGPTDAIMSTTEELDIYSTFNPRPLVSSTTPEQMLTSSSTSTTVPNMIVLIGNDTRIKKRDPLCRTVACNEKASHIISQMNHLVSPCEDFYEFACGGIYEILEESGEVKDAELLQNQLSNINDGSAKYLKDFKTFYESCLEYEDDFNYKERMKGVKDLLAKVGTFELNLTRNLPKDEFTDLVAELILRQSMPLFDIGLDVDQHSSNFVLQLTLPLESTLRTGMKEWSGLLLHKERCLKKQKSELSDSHLELSNIYEMYNDCHKNYSFYLNSIGNVIEDFESFSTLPPTEREKKLSDIGFNIEFDVLKILTDSLPLPVAVLETVARKNFTYKKVSELQTIYPILHWTRLFETLTGHQIRENTLVQLYFSTYFDEIFRDPKNLKNSLLAIHAYDLFVNTVQPKETENRELFCFDLSKQLLPDVWAHFTQSILSSDEKKYEKIENEKKVKDLFVKLKRNFCNTNTSDNWMDESTSNSFLLKCNKLDLVLFEPPNEDTLQRNYQYLEITTDYQTSLIKLLTNLRKNIYSLEGTPTSSSSIFSYFLDPLSSKSLTLYATNSIAVPPGLMRKFSKSLPNYLVMASAGFNLAQQMARHFDPTGIKYQFLMGSGSEKIYSETVTTYDDFQNYFNRRIVRHKNVSFHLTGPSPRNDMFVDNAAFRLIYDSLESYSQEGNDMLLPWISGTYSREKIFFIAAAQEFCKRTTVLDFMLEVFERGLLPPLLRVENMMSNSEGFIQTFECFPGSGMYVPEKMSQFPHLKKFESYDDEYNSD